jgi:hypothetical protein
MGMGWNGMEWNGDRMGHTTKQGQVDTQSMYSTVEGSTSDTAVSAAAVAVVVLVVVVII